MKIDLEEVATVLDLFPHWDESMRAEVFHAIDVAPVKPVTDYEGTYWGSPAERAWNRVGSYTLEEDPGNHWPLTLGEASGYESAPTKEEILKALYRGERMVRG